MLLVKMSPCPCLEWSEEGAARLWVNTTNPQTNYISNFDKNSGILRNETIDEKLTYVYSIILNKITLKQIRINDGIVWVLSLCTIYSISSPENIPTITRDTLKGEG